MNHRQLAGSRALVPLAVLLVLSSEPLWGQVVGGSTLRGRITSPSGQALAGALVIRSGLRPDTVRADTAGRFVVPRLARGRHVFVVRHPGFEMVEMEVDFPADTTLDVDVPLAPVAGRAAATAGELAGRLDSVGFARRRQAAEERRARVAFLGPDELANRGSVRVSQLFDGMNDVRVRVSGRYTVVYGDAGRCVMSVWIDGTQETTVYPSGTRDLDEVIEARDVAAIEVYPRSSQVPPEFQRSMQIAAGRGYQTRTSDCGAIVIWRR